MTRTLVALATAALISVAAAAPAISQTVGVGFNTLTGFVFNELNKRKLPTDTIGTLSLNQIAAIRSILDDGELHENEKTDRIKAIIKNL